MKNLICAGDWQGQPGQRLLQAAGLSVHSAPQHAQRPGGKLEQQQDTGEIQWMSAPCLVSSILASGQDIPDILHLDKDFCRIWARDQGAVKSIVGPLTCCHPRDDARQQCCATMWSSRQWGQSWPIPASLANQAPTTIDLPAVGPLKAFSVCFRVCPAPDRCMGPVGS